MGAQMFFVIRASKVPNPGLLIPVIVLSKFGDQNVDR